MPDTLESIASAMEARIREMASIGADDSEFNRDTHVFDYGYIDSFGAAELVAWVETTWKFQVPNEDLAHRPLNTVNEMAQYIFEKTSA